MRPKLPVICAAAALIFTLASAGCGGSKPSSNTPDDNGDTGNGSAGNGDTTNGDSANGDEDKTNGSGPGARLVAMVEEISAKVTSNPDCDAFATALANWTNRYKKEFEKLVAEVQAAAANGEPDKDAEDMDEKIVTGYLAVVEAAAECGENDSAMRAYEASVVYDKSCFPALSNLALVYERLGFTRKGAETWRKALEHAPDDAAKQRIQARLAQHA